MKKNYVKVDGESYEIKEPTVSTWMELMKFKDVLEEHEMNLKLISLLTGIDVDTIRDGDVKEINKVGSVLSQFLNQDTTQIFQEIEFEGTKYKIFDVNKMTFGQFVDIDSFLRKDET